MAILNFPRTKWRQKDFKWTTLGGKIDNKLQFNCQIVKNLFPFNETFSILNILIRSLFIAVCNVITVTEKSLPKGIQKKKLKLENEIYTVYNIS